MSEPITLMLDQQTSVGITFLDKSTPPAPINDASQLPSGWRVEITSSDPAVVGVHMRPDGLNADLSSDAEGTSTVTVTVFKADGTTLLGTPDSDVITVVKAIPGQANVTWGAPQPEPTIAPAP